MRATINGLRYDTETAVKIGGDRNGHPGDFHHWEAELYRTPRSGQYFIAGKGGAFTHFGRPGPSSNERRSGERIIPMTAEDARAWAEQHLDGAVVEVAFAPPEDDTEDDERLPEPGFVYILDAGEGVIKIGKSRTPRTRARQWKLPILAYVAAADMHAVERALHHEFRPTRIGIYELFRVPATDAVRSLEALGKD